MGYGNDREWGDRWIPEMRKIIGPLLLCPAPLEEDRCFATDLIVLQARDHRIACRVRRPGYENFWHEFTMRRSRESGAKTELAKFVEGFGDWFFYGHAAREGPSFARWMVIDLAAWRSHLIRHRSRLQWRDIDNNDGETTFRAYDVRSFPPDPPLLIAEYVPPEALF